MNELGAQWNAWGLSAKNIVFGMRYFPYSLFQWNSMVVSQLTFSTILMWTSLNKGDYFKLNPVFHIYHSLNLYPLPSKLTHVKLFARHSWICSFCEGLCGFRSMVRSTDCLSLVSHLLCWYKRYWKYCKAFYIQRVLATGGPNVKRTAPAHD